MATYKLASFFDADGNKLYLSAGQVYYKGRKLTLEELLASTPTNEEVQGMLDELKEDLEGEDLKNIQDALDALQKEVDDFLKGDATDNDTVDRLKELIALIQANKDSIDGILGDYLKGTDVVDNLTSTDTDKPLSANQGSVIAGRLDDLEGDTHTHDNKETILDLIGKAENSGNLTFNGKELNGETGIAMGASLETANTYTNKLRIVVENYEEPAAEQPGA